MFDEVAPPATAGTPTTTATAPGMPPGSSNSGSGGGSGPSSRSRGRHRVQKTRNNAKNAASNGHATSNNEVGGGLSGKNIEACASDSSGSTSDLEDAVGSPNESTTALIRKVRRKSDLSALDQELMRIVGQHLHNIGLKTSADVLMAEAGTTLIHPTAANFKKMVLNGDWSLAVKTLEELKNHLENPDNIVEMKFLLLEQKYLELISKRSTIDALKVLQVELSALKHNQARVHELSSYLMLSDPDEIARVTRSHQGSKATDLQARLDLMHRLQAFIPASVMLPPGRLMT